jgi:hypothetical protein
VFSVIIELSPLPLLKFALVLSLISKLMVTYLDDRMVNTHNVQNGAENSLRSFVSGCNLADHCFGL